MKKILALLTSLSSVPMIGTIPVACSTNSQADRLDTNISKELGLVNFNNQGIVSASITVDQNHQAQWRLDNFNYNLTAGALLNPTDKQGYATAKSSYAYNFLKDNLKIEPKSGSYFTDALFDYDIVNQIQVSSIPNTIHVTVKPTLNKKDCYIAQGSYDIQFMRGTEKLDRQYSVALKSNDEKITDGIISNFLSTNHLSYDNYKIPGFKIGSSNSYPQTGTDVTNYLDIFKSFFKLIKQDGLKILIIGKNTSTATWQSGDTLELQITLNNIITNFHYTLTVQKHDLGKIKQKDFAMKLNYKDFVNKDYNSLTSLQFNLYSPVFKENNLFSFNVAFNYSDNPFTFNDMGTTSIKASDIVYVQINININDKEAAWAGTSQWLQIMVTN